MRRGPRLGDLAVQTSSYGSAIPRIYGRMRVAGTVIWATDLKEEEAIEDEAENEAYEEAADDESEDEEEYSEEEEDEYEYAEDEE